MGTGCGLLIPGPVQEQTLPLNIVEQLEMCIQGNAQLRGEQGNISVSVEAAEDTQEFAVVTLEQCSHF